MASHAATRQQARGQWGRLKAVQLDPLEEIGLPLLDFKTQEQYYEEIVERYTKLSNTYEDAERVEASFASLSLNGNGKPESSDFAVRTKYRNSEPRNESRELSVIIQAMRKIREGIVASHRLDGFAQRVYVFIIRATIMLKHMQSYHPALLYLLQTLHPVVPLSTVELDEFVGYRILDLACRQDDLGAAYESRHKHHYYNDRIHLVLKALVHGNWLVFWRLKTTMDERQRCIMEPADERMRIGALESLGKSYLKLQKEYVECATNCGWETLKQKYKPNWVEAGQMISTRGTRNS